MEVKEIQENDFKKVINDNGKVLVDCYATWCGPCKMLSPIIEQVASTTDDVKFYKLDIDEAEEVAGEYEIMSIPTLLFFKDGKLEATKVGFAPKEEIEEMIK